MTEIQHTYLPNLCMWSSRPCYTKWSDFVIGRRETLRCLAANGRVKVSAYIDANGHMRYTGPVTLPKKRTSRIKYRINVILKQRGIEA